MADHEYGSEADRRMRRFHAPAAWERAAFAFVVVCTDYFLDPRMRQDEDEDLVRINTALDILEA